MGLLIDSNVLLAIEREDRGISTLFDAVGDEDAALSVVTASELLHGVHRNRRRNGGFRRIRPGESMSAQSRCRGVGKR